MPPPDSAKIKEKVRRLPHQAGVYLMKDRFGGILYVGKAKDLKKRVGSYFQPSRRTTVEQPKVAAMISLVHDFDTIEVRNETEALLLEGRLIKEYKPRYNTDFTDNKQFLLVRVETDAELPRFRLTRNRREDGARYFGPFAHSGMLRKTLGEMRRRFGILLGDAKPVKLEDGRWRLYDDIRREIYGHANEVTPEEYQGRVEAAGEFLEGKSREWLEDLRAEMAKAAASQQYERAAELRDMVFAMERTISPHRRFTRRAPEVRTDYSQALERLGRELGLPGPAATMECFDISHISGTFVVASLVHFRDGRPDKNQYRRFRIKTFIGNDDYRAMEEVVGRRYRRLRDEGKPLPGLVVIDGGKGQVHAALKAFLVLGIEPPPLVGLAKKEESVVFPGDREPLRLAAEDPALHLLQRLRDEAHRFANTYNAELRSRKIRESILDDFEGLGPVRRTALMERFRSLERLRKATAGELQQVEGIGPKLAAQLRAFLDAHTRDSAASPGPQAGDG